MLYCSELKFLMLDGARSKRLIRCCAATHETENCRPHGVLYGRDLDSERAKTLTNIEKLN